MAFDITLRDPGTGFDLDLGGAPTPPDTDPLGLPWIVLGWPGDPLVSPPPSNGANISTWRDASGNSRTFTQGTLAKQPTMVTSSANLNGQPAWNCDGTEAIGSSTFTAVNEQTLVVVVWVNTAQSASLGYLASGYDTMIRMDAGTNAEMYCWGSSTATDILAGDIRGEAHLFMAYFNGASSRWRVDDTTGTAPLMAGGNDFLTRLTAGAWDGNVSGDTINGQWGLIGAADGDVLDDAGFLGWVTNTFGITTGYGGGAYPLALGATAASKSYVGATETAALYLGGTPLWP